MRRTPRRRKAEAKVCSIVGVIFALFIANAARAAAGGVSAGSGRGASLPRTMGGSAGSLDGSWRLAMAAAGMTPLQPNARTGSQKAGFIIKQQAVHPSHSLASANGGGALLNPLGAGGLKVAPVSAFGFLPPAAPVLKPSRPAVSKPGLPAAMKVAAPSAPGLAASPKPQDSSIHAALSSPSIVLDGSLGQTQQPVITSNADGQNDYGVSGMMGKEVGSNLFFSFSSFGLATNESVTFTAPGMSIQNILSRVTGGSPSSIDGTIRTSGIPGANFFLLNPAGILFGAHASLDIGGSFVVSTADYLKLADGARFAAVPGPLTDGGLSSAPPSAFGFLSASPAAVSIAGSNTFDLAPETSLSIAPGACFSIVAGGINISGQQVRGEGSRVNLISVNSPGEVGLAAADPNSPVDVSAFSAMGDINLTSGATIDTSGALGGPIVIRGSNLLVDYSRILSDTGGVGHGGAIDVMTTGSVWVTGTGRSADAAQFTGEIQTSTSGPGIAGDLNVTSPLILLTLGGNLSGYARASATSTGQGGHIHLNCDELDIGDEFSVVNVDTAGVGAGGSIDVKAHQINIIGSGDYTGLIAETGRIDELIETGRGGDISVQSDSIYLANGGQFATTILGTGDAGTIRVNASTVTIDSGGSINSQADHHSTGRAGTIIIDAGALKISNGVVSAVTFTSGHGGDIEITANSVVARNGGAITAESFPSPYGAPDGGAAGS